MSDTKSEIKDLMAAAIFLWEQIPWEVNPGDNSFHRLPEETQRSLSTFGVGLRRLETHIDVGDKSAEYTELEEQYRKFREDTENQMGMYRQQLERANQQLAMLSGQKERAQTQATRLEAQVANQNYTDEDMAKLEGQIVSLNQTVQLLTDRNAELETLLESYKNPDINNAPPGHPQQQYPAGVGPQGGQPVGNNWQPSKLDPLKSIT